MSIRVSSRRLPVRRGCSSPARGFSLLEVILALAIMAGAAVTLGEAMRSGLRSAQVTRDLTRAQMLCESKMSELASGVASLSTTSDAPCELDPEWSYSVQTSAGPVASLVMIEVTVHRPGQGTSGQVSSGQARSASGQLFTLRRWMLDPSLATTETSTAPANSSESNQFAPGGAGQRPGGSNNGNGAAAPATNPGGGNAGANPNDPNQNR